MKILLTAALLAAVVAPAAVSAAPAAPARNVSTAGVDFRDPAALQAFYQRLKVATVDVCDSNSANPVVTQRDRLCRQKALTVAVQSLNRPLLTALHHTESSYVQAAR